jgi:hypothetical protein
MLSRKSGFTVIFCLLLTSIALASTADLAGTWVAIVEGQNSAHTFTFVFDVKGDTFTGTVTPDSDQAQPISDGKIEGNKITFKAGPPNDLAYFTGTVEGDDLKLSLADSNGQQQLVITATRKKSGK